MQKEFTCYGRTYTIQLDDWIVIIQYHGQIVKVYNTELWTTWDNVGIDENVSSSYIQAHEQSILDKAVELFQLEPDERTLTL